MDTRALRRADDAVTLALSAVGLGPEEGLVRLQDMARYRAVPHVGFSIDRRARAEPVAFDPVDALHRIVPSAGSREQHKTVVPQRRADSTHRILDCGKAAGALDGEGSVQCRLRDCSAHLRP